MRACRARRIDVFATVGQIHIYDSFLPRYEVKWLVPAHSGSVGVRNEPIDLDPHPLTRLQREAPTVPVIADASGLFRGESGRVGQSEQEGRGIYSS